MNNHINTILTELKDYCYKYLQLHYGTSNNFIRRTKITKNGLFIYGHKVYAPIISDTYTIYTFISWYDADNYEYINDMLEYFVNDCKRLKEAN